MLTWHGVPPFLMKSAWNTVTHSYNWQASFSASHLWQSPQYRGHLQPGLSVTLLMPSCKWRSHCVPFWCVWNDWAQGLTWNLQNLRWILYHRAINIFALYQFYYSTGKLWNKITDCNFQTRRHTRYIIAHRNKQQNKGSHYTTQNLSTCTSLRICLT